MIEFESMETRAVWTGEEAAMVVKELASLGRFNKEISELKKRKFEVRIEVVVK